MIDVHDEYGRIFRKHLLYIHTYIYIYIFYGSSVSDPARPSSKRPNERPSDRQVLDGSLELQTLLPKARPALSVDEEEGRSGRYRS